VTRRRAGQLLTWIWYVGGSVLLLLVIVMTQRKVFGHLSQEVFQWFLPHVLPTVGIITSALLANQEHAHANARVRVSVVLLAAFCSVGYLSLVTHALIAEAQVASAQIADGGILGLAKLQFLATANWWLGPMQGIVDTFMGYLFVAKTQA
jgi:hypothetical protein